ncbi:MAG: hypothetical protein K2W84_13790 [Burkholderiales bacterium]|nr:hypothetical protein [Burkholderiales bacterium]
MRWMTFLLLCVLPVALRAQTPPAQSPGLSCEQMVAAAQAGIDQRNQGASLSRVLAELERPELRERLSAEDYALLRRAVQMSYTSEISIHELAETCNASRGVKPKR